MINRCVRALHCVVVLFFVTTCTQSPAAVAQSGTAAAMDPLPSWNDGQPKAAIQQFVKAVATTGSPDFVPAPQRIATFDNDGTLWAEQPMYFQFFFVVDRIRALADKHPDWKTKEPYHSVLAGDMKAFAASGEKGAVELLAVTHAGMTIDQFADDVRSWMQSARHPISNRPYTEMVYQPMLELLAYLRANGFTTFIVSGGGTEFMRP